MTSTVTGMPTLDMMFRRLPRKVKSTFSYTVGDRRHFQYKCCFQYETFAYDISYNVSCGISAKVKIVKRYAARNVFGMRPKIWGVHSGIFSAYLVGHDGRVVQDMRTHLLTDAVNKGIMLTEPLLDRTLGTIERNLQDEMTLIKIAREKAEAMARVDSAQAA